MLMASTVGRPPRDVVAPESRLRRPSPGWSDARASPTRAMRNVAIPEDAGLAAGGDNACTMTAEPHNPLQDVADELARASAAMRRVLAGPDGPLAAGLVLGLVAVAEVTLYTDDVSAAVWPNLLATVPLALARRWLALATGAIVFGALLAVSDPAGTLTIAALVALLGVLSLFAARYRRRWSALLVLPFLVNAIDPYDGSDPGFAPVLLLFVVV